MSMNSLKKSEESFYFKIDPLYPIPKSDLVHVLVLMDLTYSLLEEPREKVKSLQTRSINIKLLLTHGKSFLP